MLYFQTMMAHVRRRLIVVQPMRSVFLVDVHVRADISFCCRPTRVNAVSVYNSMRLDYAIPLINTSPGHSTSFLKY